MTVVIVEHVGDSVSFEGHFLLGAQPLHTPQACMEQLLIIKLILQLREVLRIMWLLLEHFLEKTDFDLIADRL